MTISDSLFRNNVGYGGCGAITNLHGAMAIKTTTFAGNATAGGLGGSGGAICNWGTLTVDRSVFANNQARGFGHGGGIISFGTLAVANSTFVGNTAGGVGGGISGFGDVTIVTNATFTGNKAMGCSTLGCLPDGAAGAVIGVGGSMFGNGVVSLRNTIVANSTKFNCRGVTDGGHNLDDGTSCGFDAARGSLSNTDPKLDPRGLRDNGGPTQTIALRPDSPAIAAGDAELCADDPVNGVDQRGKVRPAEGRADCSMGAYEIDAEPPPCVGDCSADCVVTVGELQTGLKLFSGDPATADCPAFTATDSAAEIGQQLQSALTNVFEGCPLCVSTTTRATRPTRSELIPRGENDEVAGLSVSSRRSEPATRRLRRRR